MKKLSAKATNNREITDRLFGNVEGHRTGREIVRARSSQSGQFVLNGIEFKTIPRSMVQGNKK